jgi:hypothetical protein
MFKKTFYTFLSSLLLSTFCYANNTFESSYTSITAQDCTLQDSNPVLEYASQNCKSFSDEIDVKVIEEEARQTVEFSRGSQDYPLNLQPLGFSKLGPKIEWRYKKGRPNNIVGMIVRLNVSEQAGGIGKVTSYLIVSKVTPSEICVIGKIPPLSGGQQNKQARLIAERSAQMPCLDAIDKSSIKTKKIITPRQDPTKSDYYDQHITDARVTDSDGDGINNYDDLCPSIADPKQEDKDGDQVGDACDACPNEVAQRYSTGCLSASDKEDNTEKVKSGGILKSLLKWKPSTL